MKITLSDHAVSESLPARGITPEQAMETVNNFTHLLAGNSETTRVLVDEETELAVVIADNGLVVTAYYWDRPYSFKTGGGKAKLLLARPRPNK